MPQTARLLKVFLCHAHSDKDAVKALYDRLTKDGVDAWLDKEKLLPGQSWRIEIQKAVRNADVAIVCHSREFNQAGFRQREVKWALDTAMEKPEGEIFVIPARLEECEVLDSLGEWQWVDLFADNGYEMLMRALQACADSIGATLLAKRSWLPKISTPPAKSGKPIIPEVPVASKKDQPEVVTGDAEAVVDTRRPEVPPKPKKEPIKLKAEYVIAIIGAVATMIAAIIGSPLIGRIFSQSPEPAATATYQLQALPTDTLASVIKTDTPSPILTPTKTLTPAPTELPLVITDVKGVEMVLVSEGKFMMGSDSGENNEKPPHEVVLDAYYIDKYEVTNALYKECVHAGACYLPTDTNKYNNSQYAQHPVVYVDWNMAKTYCEWRGAKLPTEAQWEKAARGTDGRTYPWGEGIDKTYANYGYINIGDTTPVGDYPKGVSPYGAYDMAGNVWEWVADWYDENHYATSPKTNPTGPETGYYRLMRGGAWGFDNIHMRSAYRNWSVPVGPYLGFRCSRVTLFSEITDSKGVQMVLVPEGEFTMGNADVFAGAQPVHQVFLDAYYIDKYEVTNALYEECVDAGACDLPTDTNEYNNSQYVQYPVVYVNWNMAKAYCEWRGGKLPTEAQWEKAARGPNGRTFPWGNYFDGSIANFCDSSCSNNWANKGWSDGYPKTAPVGSYPDGVSPYEAYDMAGNVWEWIADWYDERYYATSSKPNPTGPVSGNSRVLRGGSWNSVNVNLYTAFRGSSTPLNTNSDVGVRCARGTSP